MFTDNYQMKEVPSVEFGGLNILKVKTESKNNQDDEEVFSYEDDSKE